MTTGTIGNMLPATSLTGSELMEITQQGDSKKVTLDAVGLLVGANKVEKAPGKVLTSNDFTNSDKAKLDALDSESYSLKTWAYTNAFQLVNANRDFNGAITSALIVWPDGSPGLFTTVDLSTAFPGAIDSWEATHISVVTKTITQPRVTRDANGAVIAQPAITIK